MREEVFPIILHDLQWPIDLHPRVKHFNQWALYYHKIQTCSNLRDLDKAVREHPLKRHNYHLSVRPPLTAAVNIASIRAYHKCIHDFWPHTDVISGNVVDQLLWWHVPYYDDWLMAAVGLWACIEIFAINQVRLIFLKEKSKFWWYAFESAFIEGWN